MKKDEKKKIIIKNNKIREYKIFKKFEAGLVLNGSEVKSLRNYNVSIDNAFFLIQKNEIFIIKMYISDYIKSSFSSSTNKEKNWRWKKILLHKDEIIKIIQQIKSKNLLLTPLCLFFNNKGLVKLEIALAKHLKKYEIKKMKKIEDEKNEEKNNYLYY